MTEIVETAPLRGVRATWDGSNFDEVRELTGDLFLSVSHNVISVRGNAGTPVPVPLGYSIIVWDDEAGLTVTTATPPPWLRVLAPAATS